MSAFVIFALIVLFFTVLVLIGKTNELSEDVAGKGMNYDAKSKWNGYFLLAFVILFFVSIVYQVKLLAPIMIPKSASYHGDKTDNLFYVTLFFMSIVFVLTQFALFYFAYRYNQGVNKKALFYSHNNKLEVIWTVIPAIVLAVLVVMGMRVWFQIFDVESRDKNAMVIEVTAKQFQWMARYPGPDGKFGHRILDTAHITPTNELGIDWTDANSHDDFWADKLVFIKDKPVLVKLGALDVIHSFYLPHFRVKMDCVPGIPTQFYFTPKYTTEEMRDYLKTLPWWQTTNPETGEPRWKTFKYELACTEICGRSHYGMQKEVVVVKDEAEYNEWVKKQSPIYVAAPPAAPADSAKTASKEGEDLKMDVKKEDKDKKVVSELTGGSAHKASK
jgi:cytochrome c oxidase subunit 2